MPPKKNGLCLLLGLIGIGTAAVAQNGQIIVQAVDGRTGKPIASQHLLVFGGDSPQAVRQHKKQFELTTDKDGLASLTLVAGTQWLQVWMDWHVLCQANPNGKSFSVTDIVVSGVSTPNTCSKVSRKATPGRLVVFVRPDTFSERMRR